MMWRVAQKNVEMHSLRYMQIRFTFFCATLHDCVYVNALHVFLNLTFDFLSLCPVCTYALLKAHTFFNFLQHLNPTHYRFYGDSRFTSFLT